MYPDEVNAKLRASQEHGEVCDPRTAAGIGYQNAAKAYYESGVVPISYRSPTLREEAEKQVGYHREQADKQDRAIAFLRENPAFDEFVRLVRAGAIQF